MRQSLQRNKGRLAAVLLLSGCMGLMASPALAKGQSGIVAGEMAAFANQLALKPDVAIDLTGVSGEYCFDGNIKKGGHMTHYATDPTRTKEDVVDFVNAKPLMDAGANFDGLPHHNGKLGSMEPNQWYFLAAGEYEPHHGKKLPFPLLIRASNIK